MEIIEGIQQQIVDGVVEGLKEELSKLTQKGVGAEDEDRYMNKKEVTEYVGISYPTLDRWIDAGLDYSLINGKQYVFDKKVVVDFIKKHSISYLEN